ncbi:hypothetical protein [Aureimonas psammosilenae]|uniref:hypothetical protein n=1 Tax=Aureimonas psammosilenae TaxID=2495496 RepID=UPI001F3A8039|nr:hypothetical protein [Aureimonas psammosilenae]
MSGERSDKADARRQRLEETLRENLKRRKDQARARRQRPADETEGSPAAEPAPDEE